ncbi:MAG TPA: Zn-dependent hydrolase [Tenuifilaceae bacterium]|nr:Zn-dependent hydrolase [Tenuifilaceae bacterium]HPE17379.1 Zn-dependent hydrolase [Tenuifilaceae bacterium]HPJ46646.1 Zn-dependent hydrolase [Tenuifilaceae bacterium]HPQ33514.1 Zn-dependent hydrolase [Tenuifilaceae bacterium]HRX66853.1 Zn-dependent hydrolase [Tenuifilaceae bacterium]
MKTKLLFTLVTVTMLAWACQPKQQVNDEMQKKVDEFVEVELKADISHLSENEKKMLPILFETAKLMEDVYWTQAYGDKEELLQSISDEATRKFIELNYGPWERLKGNKPFIEGVGEKPLGAGFYPKDMTREEFEKFESDTKASLYTIIKRNADGSLESVPYSVAYKEQHEKAAELLRKAAELADDEGLKNYLNLRAEALVSDNYQPSDLAWMDMKTNNIDFVVGPIENYEDALFNYKAAHEAFILIKDNDWSQKLSRFAALLPALQESLPVEKNYKMEVPGSDSDLGVYEAVFYAGDCNAGSKTIAINLPNDPEVHIQKGSRKLQLKNSMRYKFDKILVPISDLLIDSAQRKHITFDAFFENTMFHEVAHGLGIKNTINGKGTVREAMKETYSSIEEGKADILGLYMVAKLAEMGELQNKDLMDNYVTFMAGIFRSVRFGAASAHGKANMMRFYYFQEKGAFTRNPETGTYKVDFDKMTEAMNSLANLILTVQGDGNYEKSKELLDSMGFIKEELQADLNRIGEANIPRDIRFKQGPEMLGL